MSLMRKLLERWVRPIAHGLGVVVVPEWALGGLPLETHLRRLFRALAIETVLDIGANKGQFRDFLRNRVGFTGVIHSFEPEATLVSQLDLRARSDADWIIHAFALGRQSSVLSLNVMAQSGFNSFLEPDTSRTASFTAGNTIVGEQRVQIQKLDDLFHGLRGHGAPTYLKIDTQGFDVEVLAGAEQVLPRINALQFELAVQPIYKGVPDYLDVLRGLNEMGFDLSGMFPVAFDELMRVVEFDCVMVARRWQIITPRT